MPVYDNELTVSQLNGIVSEALKREPRLKSVTVRGEISGFKHHIPSGHWYFSLKDEGSVISCVMFRSSTLRASARPADGEEVCVTGYVEAYTQQGKYQLYCTGIRPAGRGDLYRQFELLKQKLNAEGLFDLSRKKNLPMLPRKVALVTSPSGAALHDILNVSGNRAPFVPVVLIPTAVQGAGAAEEIAIGIRQANALPEVDVIIVGRGGGSVEDLWCFNEEAVARAVAESRVPVVSGVGHEVDISICDLVADVRAATPSHAAEIVFPDRKELLGRTGLMREALVKAAVNRTVRDEKTVRILRERLSRMNPQKRIENLTGKSRLIRENLLHCTERMAAGKTEKLQSCRQMLIWNTIRRAEKEKHRLERIRERLEAISPLGILNRGYTLVFSRDGQLIHTAKEAASLDVMKIRFADGNVRVRKDTTHGDE